MKKLLLLLIPCVALAGTEPINLNTADGHVKKTSSGTGELSKPISFCDVAVAGIPFLSLADTPSTYSGQALKLVRVNAGATALEFVTDSSGSGTVTSVTATAPIVVTPSPITTTGVISLANTAVTPGSYTSTDLTVDAQGRITAASSGGSGITPAALTRTNDTNVTLTLGGTPATALLQATSLTLGWAGTLATGRGGTGVSSLGNLTDAGTDGIVVTGGTGTVITNASLAQHVADTTHNGYLSSTDWNTFNGKQSALTLGDLTDAGTDGITVTGGTGAVIGSGTSLSQHVADTTHSGYLSSTDWNTFNGHSTVTPAALTKTNDTNVTLTLGGTPTTALLQATSLTLGWTGTLAAGRGGTGVSSLGDLTKADDTNVTLTLGGTPTGALTTSTSITAGWTGTLSQARGGFGKSTASTTDGQIPIGKTSDGSWNVNTITAGTGISVTNGAGAITIANTGVTSSDVSDTAYASSWNGVTTTAPSKNAVYDELHLIDTADDGTIVNAGTGFRIGGAAASGKILVGNGTNYVASTPTYPNASATSGKVIVSDGTNYVASTPTFPNASATSGKIIKSDGTNWVASTETYAAPGSSGNLLTSDGTNWTSAAPSAGTHPVGGSITTHGDSIYTILSTDKIVALNATLTTTRVWTLPAASAVAAGYSISVIDAVGGTTSANAINITRAGSDTIQPGSQTQIPLKGTSSTLNVGAGIQLTSDGSSKWYVTYTSPGVADTSGMVMAWQNSNHSWQVSDFALPFFGGVGSAGKIFRSNGTSVVFSNPTWPDSGTTGKIIIGNGTNYVESTPTWPTAAGTSGNEVVSDGTNFVSLTKVATPLSTADTTVSNQQTPTTGGVTMASQTLASGTMWWIHAFGDYTSANSATARNMELQPKWNTTNLTKVAVAIKANTAVTSGWIYDGYIVGTSTTAAWVSGVCTYAGASTVAGQTVTATSASNTSLSSGAQTLDFTVDTSASVVGDSIVVKGVLMQRVK